MYHIYCDESRQSQDRFMVLGGIGIPANNMPVFEATMEKYRKDTEMNAELKWSKVSNQKYSEYKMFVDYFFALNNTNYLNFHSMILDNHQINHRKFNHNDAELGFYKFYYQLLLHTFGRHYCKVDRSAQFIVYLDERTTKYKLSTLKSVLNRGIMKKYGVAWAPFRSIEPRDSKKSNMIQVNDLIIGAIGYQKNGYDMISNAKQSKIDLAQHIAVSVGLSNLKNDTIRSNKRFSIWNFQLKK